MTCEVKLGADVAIPVTWTRSADASADVLKGRSMDAKFDDFFGGTHNGWFTHMDL